MATYTELYSLQSDDSLRNKVAVACIVAAEAIRVEDGGTANHANRLLWAKASFEDPIGAAEPMLRALLAANKAATEANISGASDVSIQTNVDAAVDIFATG